MAQNARELRVIDPILTSIVQGYKNAACVGDALFPHVNVPTSSGTIITFGKESFQSFNTLRTPGAATRRIEFGYAGKPYALEFHSIEAKVPREYQREADVPHIDLAKRATDLAMKVVTRGLESAQAALATDPANYDNNHRLKLTGAQKWSDPDSSPKADIEAAKEAIRSTIGIRPNVLLLSPAAFNALKDHPAIIERFKYTTHDILTVAMLQSHLDIPKIVVGEDVWANDKGTFSDTWGNHAVLAYVPPVPSTEEEPSYGYTYVSAGHPFVEEPYFDEVHKSHIYGVTFERLPVIAGMQAGFLFQDAG